MNNKPNVDALIYSPSDAVTYATEYLTASREAIDKGFGLHFPIQNIAEEYPIPPMMPGKIWVIAAVTSHGKTTFKDFWIGDLVRRIQSNPNAKNEHIVISISTETTVEDQMVNAMRRQAETDGSTDDIQDIDGLLQIATRVGSVPVYYIGRSLGRASFDTPPVNMTSIMGACKRIVDRRADKGLKTVVEGVFLDYIQRLDFDPEIMRTKTDKRRHLQVGNDMHVFSKLCTALPAPGVVCAQCKTPLMHNPGKNMQTPGLLDIQEATALAHYTDRAMSLWMPWNTHPPNSEIEYSGERFKVLPNLAVLRITKQRCKDPYTLMGLPKGRSWPLRMVFETGNYVPFGSYADTLTYDQPRRHEKRREEGKDPYGDW